MEGDGGGEPEPSNPDQVDENSTVSQIRAYAASAGVKLPAKGRKADLLAALGMGE